MLTISIVKLIFIILFIVYAKWILILCLLPFQVLNNQAKKRGKTTFLTKLFRSPYTLWERLLNGGWGRYMMVQVGLFPSIHFRKWIYQALGANIGKNVIFHYRTEIRGITHLTVGNGTIIGDNAIMDARSGLELGENVNISSNVSIYTRQHDHRNPTFQGTPNTRKPIKIENRAWLGCNVIVLPGVTIGEGAVCCAGCVVTKNVEPYAVVAGIPAKKVNERPRDLNYVFKGYSCRLY